MQVPHGLPGAFAVGAQQVHSVVAAVFYKVLGEQADGARHLQGGFLPAVQQVFHVGFGDDQGVALGVPGDVQKGQGVLVLIELVAGGLSQDDLAEGAALLRGGVLFPGEGHRVQQSGLLGGGRGELLLFQPGNESPEQGLEPAPAL